MYFYQSFQFLDIKMKFVVFILAIWVAVSASPAPAPQSLSQSLTDTLTHYLGQTFHSYLGTIEKK